MNPMRFVGHWVIAGILVFAAAHPLAASVLRYDIESGGQYTYVPSPEGIGIPGCDPSDFECVFGIDGSLSVMVDADTRIATLLDVDLTLIGNDDVQQSAPTQFVTAEGVADWLEDRSFESLITAGPFEIFADETHPNLQLTDFLNGTITLSGGFNNTPSDGVSVDFELTAMVVPEPSSVFLLATGLTVALIWRRVHTIVFRDPLTRLLGGTKVTAFLIISEPAPTAT